MAPLSGSSELARCNTAGLPSGFLSMKCITAWRMGMGDPPWPASGMVAMGKWLLFRLSRRDVTLCESAFRIACP
ncbi:hypothetical protein D3C80_2049870 [compost metagenome]